MKKIILIIIFTGILVGLICFGVWSANRVCLEGHNEEQIEMPVGVVVGGSKYGGGVSIPIGNAKVKQVFVCDVYE